MSKNKTTITMWAMVNNQGTACEETALCSNCDSPKDRVIAENQNNDWSDKVIPNSWTDCTGNEALRCILCLRESNRY